MYVDNDGLVVSGAIELEYEGLGMNVGAPAPSTPCETARLRHQARHSKTLTVHAREAPAEHDEPWLKTETPRPKAG